MEGFIPHGMVASSASSLSDYTREISFFRRPVNLFVFPLKLLLDCVRSLDLVGIYRSDFLCPFGKFESSSEYNINIEADYGFIRDCDDKSDKVSFKQK